MPEDPTSFPDRRIARFLKACSGKSPNTIRTYRGVLSDYLKWHKDSEVGHESYDGYVQELRRRGRQQNGIALSATVVRQFADFRGVHVARWQVPRTKRTPVDSLAPHELDMLRVASRRSRDPEGAVFLVNFLSETGLRRSEFLSLRWPDVDLVGREVIVREAKGGESRNVPLTLLAYESTLRWGRHRFGSNETPETLRLRIRNPKDGSDNFVWPGRDPSSLLERIKMLASMAGLEARGVHTHMFRHTFATLSRKAGEAPERLQKWMGHKSLATTMRYGSVDMSEANDRMKARSLGTVTPVARVIPPTKPVQIIEGAVGTIK